MRAKIFSILGLFLLISCQKEEISKESGDDKSLAQFNKMWLNFKLESSLARLEGGSTCYMFPKEELISLQRNCHLRKIRFVPGLTNGKLDLKLQGVNSSGVGLGIINAGQVSEVKIDNQIVDLSNSNKLFGSNNELISNHLLNPKDAFNYINRWNIRSSANENLDSIVSYGNERINYFSIQKEIVSAITGLPNFENLGVFFGINPQGKMTTVLFGLDKKRNFIFYSMPNNGQNNVPPSIFDFTQPCPSTCN